MSLFRTPLFLGLLALSTPSAFAQNGQYLVEQDQKDANLDQAKLQTVLQEIRAIQILNKARPSDRRGHHIQYRAQQIEKELLKLQSKLEASKAKA